MGAIVSNIGKVLNDFQIAVSASHITGDVLPVILDQKLDYIHGVEAFRDRNKVLGEKLTANRIMVYSRGVIQPSAYATGAKYLQIVQSLVSPPNSVSILKGFRGSLPIRFLFATPDMPELELFEIAYMSKDGIRNVTGFDTAFPRITEHLNYFVHWGDLTGIDLQYSDAATYRQVVAGTCFIEGYFMVMRDNQVPSSLIEEVNMTIYDEGLAVLAQDVIVPPVSP